MLAPHTIARAPLARSAKTEQFLAPEGIVWRFFRISGLFRVIYIYTSFTRGMSFIPDTCDPDLVR